jgi:hypothetical protein
VYARALPAAFAGGLVLLDGGLYPVLTGVLLLAAAGLMRFTPAPPCSARPWVAPSRAT